ncbi:MAG: 3-isopropylmalate dehydratase large subunit [Candidatus Omnitrophica bacterium 4484_49]|nr:MAG: 3-isopropylmalate dehydratase large subunit [Candidatus Omnitrophica bacterium 4484_49]
MGMTIAEKILARHAGRKKVIPGEYILAKVDLSFANDITAPLAIKEFQKLNKPIFSRTKIALVPDHFTPNKDIRSAHQVKIVREFADKFRIRNYFSQGEVGIEHALLPEKGLIKPGDLVIGADSHTCTHGALGAFATGMGSTDIAFSWLSGKCWIRVPSSIKFIYRGRLKRWVTAKDIILFTIGDIGVDGALYKVMEFTGPVIDDMDMDGRFTLCNMAIEAGGKAGIINPDDKTLEYLKGKLKSDEIRKLKKKMAEIRSDADARYSQIREYNLSDLQPVVACPHLPSNIKLVSELNKVKIDQAVIGSCTNGRIQDLRLAAKVLKGKKVHKNVRLLIFPVTPQVYYQAMKEGLIEIFLKAGGVISPPTCGPCLGGHMGVLAEGEVAIATTNRNFRGRMGHPDSRVYLSNPAVAAASAIKGRIAHPEEL